MRRFRCPAIDWRFQVLVVLYILSGSVSPIIIEMLVLNGAADPSTMLVLLPSFVGMSLSIFSNSKAMHTGTLGLWTVLILTLFDLASARLTNQGMIDAGSTIYTIVHCSGTVFTALFAVLLLGRKLWWWQWLGIVIITAGLCMITIGMHNEGRAVFDGIIFIILGSMIHAFSYIVIEYTLVVAADPVAPEYLCAALGLTGGLVNLSWQCAYTIPRFEEVVVQRVAAQHGSITTIVLGYLGLTLAACVSSTCLYNLLHQAGSATTGVIKGLQAVLTFLTSHFAFCSSQPSQCFTPAKGYSLAIVIVGVLVYSLASPGDHLEPARELAREDSTQTKRTMSASSVRDIEMTPILEKADQGEEWGRRNSLLVRSYDACSAWEAKDARTLEDANALAELMG